MPPDEPHQPATEDGEHTRGTADPFNPWPPPAPHQAGEEGDPDAHDPEVDPPPGDPSPDPPPGDPGVAEPPAPPDPGPLDPDADPFGEDPFGEDPFDDDPFDDDEVASPPREPEVTPPASMTGADPGPMAPPLFDDGVWGAVAAPPPAAVDEDPPEGDADRQVLFEPVPVQSPEPERHHIGEAVPILVPEPEPERHHIGEAVPIPEPEPERHHIGEAVPVPPAEPLEATAAHDVGAEAGEPGPVRAAEPALVPSRPTAPAARAAAPPSARRWRAAAWLAALVMVIGVTIAFGVALALVLVNLAVRSAG